MAAAIPLPTIPNPAQRHILQFWAELSPEQQQNLTSQIAQVDWNLVDGFTPQQTTANTSSENRPSVISPPKSVVRRPLSAADVESLKQAQVQGEQALREGKVGAILLAGGQGTRLGFPHPKGTFPLGAVSGKSLFAMLAEQIVALERQFGRTIPYMIMTSDITHEETLDFFEKHNYFGLNRDSVFFFQQGYAPSLDARTGELLLAEKGSISLNPDGHGGLLAAFLKRGLFDEMKKRGVEYLYTHQIDNPLAKVCDPEFIGLHIRYRAQVSTKVVAKTDPKEKVGLAVDVDGKTAIVEYSDLPETLAIEREADGGLRYWAGSTAIHLFDRSFLEEIATSKASLPWHRAFKKIPFVNRQGQTIHPEKENGIKFERFLFDTMPMAQVALIVETNRDDEFAPLKNQSGEFSADYVRARMTQLAVKWLKEVGVSVPADVPVEMSPLFARTLDELRLRRPDLATIDVHQPIYLDR